MSGRKLSALEQKLHQAALADPKKVRIHPVLYAYASMNVYTSISYPNLTLIH